MKGLALIAVIVTCAALSGVVSAAEPGAGPKWTIEATPTIPGKAPTALNDVACVGVTCVAVGFDQDLARRAAATSDFFNGRRWRPLPVGTPEGAQESWLGGVACVARNRCTAAGYYQDRRGMVRPLVETWNGSSWQIQPTPAPAGARSARVNAVACVSADSCIAVGQYEDAPDHTVPLALEWDGQRWALQHAPGRSGAPWSALFDVSCSTVTSCVAVGEYRLSDGSGAGLTERWDGQTWTLPPAPTPAGARQTTLGGVICTSTEACIAVGQSLDARNNPSPVAQRWNGIRWRIQRTAVVPQGALWSVACTAANACTAVGTRYDAPLAERWDGAAWTTEPISAPGELIQGQLFNVDCAATSACIAVGSSQDASGAPLPLAARWDGKKWAAEPTPQRSQPAPSRLRGVDCTSPTACTAVGSFTARSGVDTPLVQRWDGRAWAIQHMPMPADATEEGTVNGVTCPSVDACFAVGSYFNESGLWALTERWDGTRWAIQQTPRVGARFSITTLSGIDCVSAETCVAVGYTITSTGTKAIAMHWDGGRWTLRAPADDAGEPFRSLGGISCSSVNACMAVGIRETAGGDLVPLAEQWDGASWIDANPPIPPGAQQAEFHGVACSSATACVAVGYSLGASGYVGLVERWDGVKWTIELLPGLPAKSSSILNAVACASASACTAVGVFASAAPGTVSPLVLRWGGTTWVVQSVPKPPGSPESVFDGVVCPTPGQCIAVGAASGSALVERWR